MIPEHCRAAQDAGAAGHVAEAAPQASARPASGRQPLQPPLLRVDRLPHVAQAVVQAAGAALPELDGQRAQQEASPVLRSAAHAAGRGRDTQKEVSRTYAGSRRLHRCAQRRRSRHSARRAHPGTVCAQPVKRSGPPSAHARLTGGRGTGMLSSAYWASSRAARSSSSARPRRSGVDCRARGAAPWPLEQGPIWHGAALGSRKPASIATPEGQLDTGPARQPMNQPYPAVCSSPPCRPQPPATRLHGHQRADLVAARPRVEVRVALLIRQLFHHALDAHLQLARRGGVRA